MVIQYLKRKELLDNSDDWTLFEIANSHSVGKVDMKPFFTIAVTNPPFLFDRTTSSTLGDRNGCHLLLGAECQ